MQIVHQSASLSYSLFPPMLLLTAPTPPKLIAAPNIAGLLPAQVSRHVKIVLDMPPTREELLRQLGPIRSREEMNAELVEILEQGKQNIEESLKACAARQQARRERWQ